MLSLRGRRLSWKTVAAFGHDLVVTALAIILAFLVRYGSSSDILPVHDLVVLLLITVPAASLIFAWFGLYSGIWRFASIPDLIAIVKAVTLVAVFLIAVDFATRGDLLVPRTVAFVYWFMGCAALGGPRLLYRIYRDGRLTARVLRRPETGIPVIIAGSSQEAEVIIRALEAAPEEILRPVGIVTRNVSHVGHRIRRVPVLGTLADIEAAVALLERQGRAPKRLILTQQVLADEASAEELIRHCRRLGLSAERLTHPALQENGKGRRVRLEPVRIEDLLARPTHRLDHGIIQSLVRGQRVLVTGGGGTIGSELCRQIVAMGATAVMVLENSECALHAICSELRANNPGVGLDERLCDVRDRTSVFRLCDEFRPDLVFHAAALKHVPIVERHPLEAVRTNALGTVNVADAAQACGARAMIMISTDKAVRPVSLMGATKRAAEAYCEALDAAGRKAAEAPGRTSFMSVRFGNVLGSSGSVVPRFHEQIERGGPITVTHPEMKRYFMTIEEAVSLVLMAAAHRLCGAGTASIYVLDMGEPVRIVDLARRMIRLAGLDPDRDIRIEFSGIRPGERIDEVLFDPREPLVPTGLDGILAATPRLSSPKAVIAAMAQLNEAARLGERPALARIRTLVPDYEGEAVPELPPDRPAVANVTPLRPAAATP